MMILLFLLQACLPTDWQYPPELRGCPSIHKREDSQVSFENGYTEQVIQAGDGKCERMTSCNPLEYAFNPQLECWPQFHSPVRKYGTWARTVTNAEMSFGAVGACREGTTQDSVPYALFGPKCATGDSDTVEVNTTCGFGGGQVPWFNPFYTAQPTCTWGFIPGVPYCGDSEPVNK
jgi:hypothetical protein